MYRDCKDALKEHKATKSVINKMLLTSSIVLQTHPITLVLTTTTVTDSPSIVKLFTKKVPLVRRPANPKTRKKPLVGKWKKTP
jgi:hypothetical protein